MRNEQSPENMVRDGVRAALASVSDLKIPEHLGIEATAIAVVSRAFVMARQDCDKAEEIASKAIADAIVAMRRRFFDGI